MGVNSQISRRAKQRLVASIALIGITGGLFLASTMPKSKSDAAVTKVVIDAGHGGKDPGNLGTGRYKVTEKTIALNVGLMVGAYIKEAFPDVEVLYTRDNDTFIPLHERTKFANTKSADLFISIHCDAFSRESAHGSGSYVMGAAKTEANLRAAQRENAAMLLENDQKDNYDGFDPNSPEGLIELSLRQNAHIHQSLKFAKQVQDQMRTRVGREDRGVKQAPFWVISFTTMPSVLIELGFLTNKEEEDFLMSSTGQDYVASAIYRAFKEYKNDLENINESVQSSTLKPPVEAPKKPENQNDSKTGIEFKVQLLSSSNPVALVPENFSGLTGVTEYKDGNLYKYMWGSASGYEEAKEMQKNVRKTGYKGAFIVAFDAQKKRIALDEALRQTTENQ